MIEKIHIIVALLAALAITILSLFQDVTFYVLCIRLVIAIPCFFVMGLFFRLYLKKLFAPPPQTENVEEGGAEGEEPLLEKAEPVDDDENYD